MQISNLAKGDILLYEFQGDGKGKNGREFQKVLKRAPTYDIVQLRGR